MLCSTSNSSQSGLVGSDDDDNDGHFWDSELRKVVAHERGWGVCERK
jgi:hypothetical protein